MIALICGENGLVNSLETVFQFGFKSSKFFKKSFIWEFFGKIKNIVDDFSLMKLINILEKVAHELENDYLMNISSNNQRNPANDVRLAVDKFIKSIRAINAKLVNFGKDGKFQILICIGCRESLLADWFKIICQTQAYIHNYEEYSFLRNQELYTFCINILNITKSFQFKLEPSLTMGIVIN